MQRMVGAALPTIGAMAYCSHRSFLREARRWPARANARPRPTSTLPAGQNGSPRVPIRQPQPPPTSSPAAGSVELLPALPSVFEPVLPPVLPPVPPDVEPSELPVPPAALPPVPPEVLPPAPAVPSEVVVPSRPPFELSLVLPPSAVEESEFIPPSLGPAPPSVDMQLESISSVRPSQSLSTPSAHAGSPGGPSVAGRPEAHGT